jgi:hypothetical protein
MRLNGWMLLLLSTQPHPVLVLLANGTNDTRGSCRLQASVPFQSDTSAQQISVEMHVVLSSECLHISSGLRVYWLNASFEVALPSHAGAEHVVQLGAPPSGCHEIRLEVQGADMATDALDTAFTRICVAQPSAGAVGFVAEMQNSTFEVTKGLGCTQVLRADSSPVLACASPWVHPLLAGDARGPYR